MRSVGISARPPARDKGKHVVKVFSELLHMLFESGWVPSMIEMDREIDRPLKPEVLMSVRIEEK